MATVYGKSSWPVPAAGDLSSGPGIVQNVATALDSFVIPKYSSAAAQTTANPSPADGDMWYRTDQSAGYVSKNSTTVIDSDSHGYIASATVTTAVASVSFTGIPTTWRHLRLFGSGRSSTATNPYDDVVMYTNGSGTTGFYQDQFLGEWSGVIQQIYDTSKNWGCCGFFWGSSVATIGKGVFVCDILDYQIGGGPYGSGWTFQGYAGDGTNSNQQFGEGHTTSQVAYPITQLTILLRSGSNFLTNTTFSLYGVGN